MMFTLLFTIFAISASGCSAFTYCYNGTIELTVVPRPNTNTTLISVAIKSIKDDGYVYFYRDGKDNVTTYYHPWFQNRVRRNGSSIYIDKAQINDTATYTVDQRTSGVLSTKHFIITVNNCTKQNSLTVVNSRHHKFTVVSFCVAIISVIFMLLFTVFTM